MDTKKIPAIFIVVAILIIALVIIIWLSRRQAQAQGGNGGNGGDLINQGTTNYIEVIPTSTGGHQVFAYNQVTGYEGLLFSQDIISYNWYQGSLVRYRDDLGCINGIQYDNAMAQFQNLGY